MRPRSRNEGTRIRPAAAPARAQDVADATASHVHAQARSGSEGTKARPGVAPTPGQTTTTSVAGQPRTTDVAESRFTSSGERTASPTTFDVSTEPVRFRFSVLAGRGPTRRGGRKRKSGPGRLCNPARPALMINTRHRGSHERISRLARRLWVKVTTSWVRSTASTSQSAFSHACAWTRVRFTVFPLRPGPARSRRRRRFPRARSFPACPARAIQSSPATGSHRSPPGGLAEGVPSAPREAPPPACPIEHSSGHHAPRMAQRTINIPNTP